MLQDFRARESGVSRSLQPEFNFKVPDRSNLRFRIRLLCLVPLILCASSTRDDSPAPTIPCSSQPVTPRTPTTRGSGKVGRRNRDPRSRNTDRERARVQQRYLDAARELNQSPATTPLVPAPATRVNWDRVNSAVSRFLEKGQGTSPGKQQPAESKVEPFRAPGGKLATRRAAIPVSKEPGCRGCVQKTLVLNELAQEVELTENQLVRMRRERSELRERLVTRTGTPYLPPPFLRAPLEVRASWTPEQQPGQAVCRLCNEKDQDRVKREELVAQMDAEHDRAELEIEHLEEAIRRLEEPHVPGSRRRKGTF